MYGSLLRAVCAVFPETGLDVDEISKHSKHPYTVSLTLSHIRTHPHTLSYFIHIDMWRGNVSKQREFFDTLAAQYKFDPIEEPHKWLDITKQDVLNVKVCVRVRE